MGKTGANGPDESCFPMALCLVSSPPTFCLTLAPEYPSFSVALLSAGQDTECAIAAPGCWLLIMYVYCQLGRSKASSGEVASMLSSFQGREHSFQLSFSFLGRKYVCP